MRTYSSLRIERAILVGFLSVITAGALFLWAFGRFYEQHITFLDAFFTSTSATCVTGLIVTDTALLPFPSQVTLMVLIQLGGLGVMTVTTALLLFMRRRIGIHEGLYLASGLNVDLPSGARSLVLRVWTIAFLIELAGAFFLYLGFREHFTPNEALWQALFHSVSAFCNAGFSTFSDGLVAYSQTLLVPAVIMVLIVAGGLGFLVIYELWLSVRSAKHISPHTVLVLRMSAILIVAGALFFGVSDHQNSLLLLRSWGWKAWNALFMSISSRTAGFNTVPMANLSGFGAFALICLMLIGASPGSTGGGMKTTTFGLLWLSTFSNLKGGESVIFRKRLIPQSNVLLALTVGMTYISTVLIGTLFLAVLEPYGLKELLFESASAMGTVGLSLDLTPHLSSPSKIVLILLMFWGRVGILTFVYGFTGRKRNPGRVTYPETGIPIG